MNRKLLKKPDLETTVVTLPDGTTGTVEHGTGNVFADSGFPDAEELKFKAELIRRISGAIKERGLTQTAAAKLIGVDQSRLSKMLRGEFLSFSTGKLFAILNRLGQRVEVRVLADAEEARTLLVA